MHSCKYVLLILWTIMFSQAAAGNPEDAIEGVIMYRGEETIALKGQWKFYWKQLYNEDTTLLASDKYKFVFCPDIWNKIETNGTKLPSYGYATYALQITCDKDYPFTALEIPEFYNAYTLYLNGEIISKNGIVAKKKETSELEWRPLTKTVKLNEGINQLVLEVSNFRHTKGGFFSNIVLGKKDHLINKREFQVILVSLMVGSLFIIGAFFLGMHLFWKHDNAVLYYALFTICFAFRLSNSGLHLFSKIFDSIPALIIIKIEYLFFYLTGVFLFLFVGIIASEDFSAKMKNIIVFITSFFAIATLVLPLFIYSKLMAPYVYFALIFILYSLFVALKILIKRRPGSFIIGMGYFLVFVWMIWTVLVYFQWVSNVPNIHNFLILLSFLLMSLVLAKRFGIAYQTIEELQTETLRQKNIIEILNQSQSRWFINIAHELRTPLTLILGPIRQFLKMHSDKPKIAIDSIQMAEKNSTRLLHLVNEILDISRLESNELKLRKKATNLTSLVRESVSHFGVAADQKGVRLKIHIQDHIDVIIDEDRIRNILINLISNALKFTHRAGQIEVSVYCEQRDHIKISVTDTGDGIPEKDLPHIFNRYYQAANSGQVNQGGTGIGLALSQELAKLHGGRISVKSHLGEGSTFTLSLPGILINNSKNADTMPPESEQVSMATPKIVTALPVTLKTIKQKKPVVLLVEDNPDMRQYILGFMEDLYQVHEAADGVEALAYLEKTIPDLIISDIMMPRMNGIALAKKLKANEHFKNIPFITVTAKADESDKINTLRIGIDDYLTKPFNAEELEARATNLIRNSRERMAVPEAEPEEIKEPSFEEKQLTEMKEFVMARLEDSALSVNDIADSQSISMSSLRRMLKKHTGLSPIHFIREIRLQKARTLLETKQYPTVVEVVYATGFEKPSHFTKLFSERFGKKPSEYLS